MPFNINEFSTQIGLLGVLKPNKFDVQIIPNNNNFYDNNDPLLIAINFRAEQFALPGVTIKVNDINRYGIGPKQKFATNVAYQTVSMTLVETEQALILKFFTQWMNKIFKMSGSRPFYKPAYLTRYKDSYVATIKITNYDDTGKENNVTLLKDAFPISISDIPLSWNDNNNLLRIKIEFAFTEWVNESLYYIETPASVPNPPTNPPTN
jgi:hypothetical protein